MADLDFLDRITYCPDNTALNTAGVARCRKHTETSRGSVVCVFFLRQIAPSTADIDRAPQDIVCLLATTARSGAAGSAIVAKK